MTTPEPMVTWGVWRCAPDWVAAMAYIPNKHSDWGWTRIAVSQATLPGRTQARFRVPETSCVSSESVPDGRMGQIARPDVSRIEPLATCGDRPASESAFSLLGHGLLAW